MAAVLTGGAARGSSGLTDRLLASGVAGGSAAVLVVTPRRRDSCDGSAVAAAASARRYTTRESGEPGTMDHRIHVVDAASGRDVSPWTDVPLFVREETAAVDATTSTPPPRSSPTSSVKSGAAAAPSWRWTPPTPPATTH